MSDEITVSARWCGVGGVGDGMKRGMEEQVSRSDWETEWMVE